MLQLIGILSGVLAVISYVPYIRDIVRRDVRNEDLSSSWLDSGLYMSKSAKPARSAWLIWTLAAIVAFLTQLQLGATFSLSLTAADALGSLVVFGLSFKYGYGGFMKRDLLGLLIVAASLVTWRITDDAFYGLTLSIAAMAVGAALTIWKTVEHPNHETYPAWILLWIASLLAAVSVGAFNIAQLAYPAYGFIFTGAILASIFLGRMKRARWANVE